MAMIQRDPGLELQLVVTGSHLSQDYGMTVREIRDNNFRIDGTIDISNHFDGTRGGVSKAMGTIMEQYPILQSRLKSDAIILLGDRYEIFAFAASALVQGMCIAHIHGGELTEGAFDDSLRHAITKMSHLHFTSTAEYRKRVIQMGESPERVFNVGSLSLDGIRSLKLLSKKELENAMNLRFSRRNLLITFHPVTMEADSDRQFQVLLKVLDGLDDTNMIFTYANADPGGASINSMIDRYVFDNPGKAIAIASMGQLRYFSAMQFVVAVVGNSSSGIIEAPSFKIGTVNIGSRQKGRVRASSVIDCEPQKGSISEAFKMLYSEEFRTRLKTLENPYYKKYVAGEITKIIKNSIGGLNLKKAFHGIDFKIELQG